MNDEHDGRKKPITYYSYNDVWIKEFDRHPPTEFYFQNFACDNHHDVDFVDMIEIAVRTDYVGWGSYDTDNLTQFCYPDDKRNHSSHYVYRNNVELALAIWLDTDPEDPNAKPTLERDNRSESCRTREGCPDPRAFLNAVYDIIEISKTTDTWTSLSANVFAPGSHVPTGPEPPADVDFERTPCIRTSLPPDKDHPTLEPVDKAEPRDPIDVFMKSDFSKLTFPMFNGIALVIENGPYLQRLKCRENNYRKTSAIVDRKVVEIDMEVMFHMIQLGLYNFALDRDLNTAPEFDWISILDAGSSEEKQKLRKWCFYNDEDTSRGDGHYIWVPRFPTWSYWPSDDVDHPENWYDNNTFPLDYCSGKYMFDHEGAYFYGTLAQPLENYHVTPYVWPETDWSTRDYYKDYVDYTCPALTRDFILKDHCAFDGDRNVSKKFPSAESIWDKAHNDQTNGCHWILSGVTYNGVFIRPLDYETCIGEITHPELFIKDPKSEEYHHYILGDMSLVVTKEEKPIFLSFQKTYEELCKDIDSTPVEYTVKQESIYGYEGVAAILEAEDHYFVSLEHYSLDKSDVQFDYKRQTIHFPDNLFSDAWIGLTGYHALGSLDMAQIKGYLFEDHEDYEPLTVLNFKSPDTWQEACGRISKVADLICWHKTGPFPCWNPFDRCFYKLNSALMWIFYSIIIAVPLYILYYFCYAKGKEKGQQLNKRMNFTKGTKRLGDVEDVDFSAASEAVIVTSEVNDMHHTLRSNQESRIIENMSPDLFTQSSKSWYH